MLCRKPYLLGGTVPFGCGQCLPCRINRRRLWSWRMFLESQMHPSSSFVTLTYSQENLPSNSSLVPKHVTDWLKRLRFALAPRTVRYFLCGEYGDLTWRPHYHVCLFGAGIEDSNSIQKAWPHGFVATCEFNVTTAQYVAGYVVKKLTSKDDPRLQGRHPEFARMSRRPGIGAAAMRTLAHSGIFTPAGIQEFQKVGDVPHQLKMGRQSIPLGRYLRRVLRDEVGMPDSYVQQLKEWFVAEKKAELLALRLNSASDAPYEVLGVKYPSVSVLKALEEANAGRIASVETRSKIFNSRRVL